MGYISQVAIVLNGADTIKLFDKAIERTVNLHDSTSYCLPILIEGYKYAKGDLLAYKTIDKKTEEWIQEAQRIIGKINSKEHVLLHWDYIKWYYDDVDLFIMPFIKRLDYYEYLRVGEEQGDIEADNRNGNYYLYAETTINTENFEE